MDNEKPNLDLPKPKKYSIHDRWAEQEIAIIRKTDDGEEFVISGKNNKD